MVGGGRVFGEGGAQAVADAVAARGADAVILRVSPRARNRTLVDVGDALRAVDMPVRIEIVEEP